MREEDLKSLTPKQAQFAREEFTREVRARGQGYSAVSLDAQHLKAAIIDEARRL